VPPRPPRPPQGFLARKTKLRARGVSGPRALCRPAPPRPVSPRGPGVTRASTWHRATVSLRRPAPFQPDPQPSMPWSAQGGFGGLDFAGQAPAAALYSTALDCTPSAPPSSAPRPSPARAAASQSPRPRQARGCLRTKASPPSRCTLPPEGRWEAWQGTPGGRETAARARRTTCGSTGCYRCGPRAAEAAAAAAHCPPARRGAEEGLQQASHLRDLTCESIPLRVAETPHKNGTGRGRGSSPRQRGIWWRRCSASR